MNSHRIALNPGLPSGHAIIFPMVSPPRQDTRFRVSEDLARQLVDSYGTPLYVIDEGHFRRRIRRYLKAFRSCYDKSELTFASKANSTLAVLAIAHAEGCLIDVASEGELRAAIAAGVPAARCHLHGNNKQREEIEYALEHGVSEIVVDNFAEIEILGELTGMLGQTKLVFRLAPGVDPKTHAKISTGQADTKFGFNIADGSAERALVRALELGLPVVGFHCHVGSQLLDPEAQRGGGELIARFAVQMLERHGFETKVLNVGGGLAARYLETDEPMEVEEYCRLVVQAVVDVLKARGLEPTLMQEPGRSLVAESGITLYRVGNVKTVPSKEVGQRTYVSVDGGLSDNPRPALYGAAYQVERVARGNGESVGGASSAREKREQALALPNDALVTVCGKHCETDNLFRDVMLPRDLAAGDILQVLTTGAYNASMANNYNRYARPATVLVRESGEQVLVQRRDTWEEMFAREMVPEGLT
jgi:diaminopimelate decarboxylase